MDGDYKGSLMIRLILNINRGFASWPFYFIPKWCVGTPEEAAYVEHEKTHCRRQRWITPVWWIRWLFSRKFRWQEESLAYRNEIAVLINSGYPVDVDYYATQLSKGYLGMISYDSAIAWIGATFGGI